MKNIFSWQKLRIFFLMVSFFSSLFFLFLSLSLFSYKKKTGERPTLPSPETVPGYWNLLRSCWHQDDTLRPSFEQITTLLSSIVLENGEEEWGREEGERGEEREGEEREEEMELKGLNDAEIGLCMWDFVAESSDEIDLSVGQLVEIFVHEGEWTRFSFFLFFFFFLNFDFYCLIFNF